MFLFNKRKHKFNKKSQEFDLKLAEANRMIDNLDFKISEFRRKFLTLQMHGRRAQSVVELENMLREMRLEAADAQRAIALLQKEHEDCVSLVQGLVDEFETVVKDIPYE